MKKYLFKLEFLYHLFILIGIGLIALTLFTKCSGGITIPEPVCQYGEITCNTIDYLCSTYPEIPASLCDLSNIACTALNILCNVESSDEAKEAAQISLVYVNTRIAVILDSMKVRLKD